MCCDDSFHDCEENLFPNVSLAHGFLEEPNAHEDGVCTIARLSDWPNREFMIELFLYSGMKR